MDTNHLKAMSSTTLFPIWIAEIVLIIARRLLQASNLSNNIRRVIIWQTIEDSNPY